MLFRKLPKLQINKLISISSYDKSIRGPQLQEKDIVLVKIVAHKGRHKLQDKWEPEEYLVVEQAIAGTPVYRVQPVTGGNIRTLHRNLLLPIGVKLEPDYDSDDSILDEDDSSSDESVISEDARNRVCDSGRLVPKSQPHSEESRHVEFEGETCCCIVLLYAICKLLFTGFLPCLDLLPVSLFCIQFPGFLVPRCALLFGEYL